MWLRAKNSSKYTSNIHESKSLILINPILEYLDNNKNQELLRFTSSKHFDHTGCLILKVYY